MLERLQKYLSECGIASRRASENLIKDGYISVNGATIVDMGFKVDADKDLVRYKGKIVTKQTEMVYIMLNKPKGYITTMHEQYKRPSVADLTEGIKERIYPVGRLDFDSRGLLLMTNDGEVTYNLTHPGHMVNKKYIVKVKGLLDEAAIGKLRQGILIDGRMTYPADVKPIKKDESSTTLEFTIHEGRNRQIRKMIQSVGGAVTDLKRISIGKLSLGQLPEGKWRHLDPDEIQYLKKL